MRMLARTPAGRPTRELATLSPPRLTRLLAESTAVKEVLNLQSSHGSAFNQIHVATCWSRLARLSTMNDRSMIRGQPSTLAPLVLQTIDAMPLQPRGVSITAHALAKLGVGIDHPPYASLWKRLALDAIDSVEDFSAHSLASTAWAFATAGVPAPELFDAVARESTARVSEFNPQGLSNTAWAFATAGVPAPELFGALAREATGRVGELNPQAMSNIAWAFATAGVPAPELFGALANEASGRLGEFSPQALSNTVYAFARADVRAPGLFDALAHESAGRVGELGPQAVSNIAWAFATLGVHAPELFSALENATLSQADRMNPQQICNVAWAFASAGVPAPGLFGTLAGQAIRRASAFSDLDVTHTAYAFAKAGMHTPKLFDALAHELVWRTGNLSPMCVANASWAFATAGIRPLGLLDALAHEATVRADEFKPHELAVTLWACATLNVRVPELLEAVAYQVSARMSLFDGQSLPSIAWSFAVFDAHSAVLHGDAFVAHVARAEWSSADSRQERSALCQLHQWKLWSEDRGVRRPVLSSSMAVQCQNAFVRAPTPSIFQGEVRDALLALGIEVREEVRLPSGYSLDLVVSIPDGTELAIEVDGPSHFVGQGREPNGSTLLKRRQLARRGWRLLSVPYWEWDHSGRSSRVAQCSYLVERLQEAVLQRIPQVAG